MKMPKLFQFSKWQLVVVIAFFISSSILPFSVLFTNNVSAAMTATQCYAYNGKNVPAAEIDPTIEQQKKECISLGYCTAIAGQANLTCSEAVYKASAQYKAAQTALDADNILNSQVSPIIDTICGSPSTNTQADAAYADCASKVKAQYTICHDAALSHSTDVAGSTASCIQSWAKATYPNKTLDNDAIAAAVTNGITKGSVKAEEILTAAEKAAQAACEAKGMTYARDDSAADEGGCIKKTAAVCTGGALGWVLCPLIDVFTDVINTTADFLDHMLFIDPIGGNPDLQNAWGAFVGLANLILVIAFLIVIFSQATSIGLSAYGIKKMLPRIIAAAILINLSYFICQIALDVTNIIGRSVGGLIQNFIPDGASLSDSKQLLKGDSWASWIGVSVAAAGAAAIAAGVGAIAFIVPLFLSAAFAAVSIFLIVALRQVVVILLIIVAPLAFAAMILPNTEPLFAKWRKLFTSMLVMYPVVMFILYGSQLVGALVLTSKSATGSDTNKWIFDIVSAIIMTVGPFAILYMYLKNSNKLMGMAAGGVGKLGAWSSKKASGWASNQYKRGKFSQAMTNRNAVLDDKARRDSIRKMEAGHGWSRLSGVGLGREGRQIRSTALADAKKTLDEREVMGHSSNLTKQAASMLASGYTRDGKDWVKKDNSGVVTDRVKQDSLDVGTRGALDYAVSNRLIGNKNGSRAIAKSLVDTGEARMDHVERLARAIDDPGERAAFVEHTRSAAQSAGLDQLKYMGIDANGNVDFAGVTRSSSYKAPDPKNKAAVAAANISAKKTVAEKMSTSRLSGINKYAFDETDSTVVETLGEKVVDIETGSPDRFATELAGMDANGVDKMAKMVYRSSIGKSMFANVDDARTHYAALHNAARAKHHSS